MRELAVRVVVGSRFHLLLAVGNPKIAAFLARLCQRDQRAVAPEEAGGHRDPFRLLTVGIQIELLYLADVLAVGADNSSAYEALWVADTHERCSSVPDGTFLGRRFGRSPSRGLGPLYGDCLQKGATDYATVAQHMGELRSIQYRHS